MSFWWGYGYGGFGTLDALIQSQKAALEAGDKAAHAQTDVALLAMEVKRLHVVCEAMWRILQEQHGWPEEKLRTMVAAIEKSDAEAALKGHVAPPCSKCGRPLARGKPRCLYCGAEHPVDLFEK